MLKYKYIKNLIKFMLVFISLLFILFILLILTSFIPKNNIEKNIKESVSFFKKNPGTEDLQKTREYSTVHYYADSIILNIIYCLDTSKPIESVMWAKYYKKLDADLNNDFIDLVENKKEPNEQYLRYWHGSMIIIRPLLVIFNIEQIYNINKIIMYGLAIVLFYILSLKNKKMAIIYDEYTYDELEFVFEIEVE